MGSGLASEHWAVLRYYAILQDLTLLSGGLNVALFTPMALASRRPDFMQAWLAETDAGEVRFYCQEEQLVHRFPLGQFLVAGGLPIPAV